MHDKVTVLVESRQDLNGQSRTVFLLLTCAWNRSLLLVVLIRLRFALFDRARWALGIEAYREEGLWYKYGGVGR